MRSVALLFVSLLMAFGTMICAAENLVVETEFARWELDGTGRTVALSDKASGQNLVAPDKSIPFCSIRKGEAVHEAASVIGEGETLRVAFGTSGIEAILRVEKFPRYFVLSVLSMNDADVDEMTFLKVPLAATGTLADPFSACALALDLQTNVPDVPGPSKQLSATAYKRFGIPGAAVAVVAAPTPALREVLKEAVAAAPGLPKHKDTAQPPIGGPWAMDTPGNRGSYLFDFGSLTEATVDKWIEMVHQLGFNQIDFHTGSSLRFGDCLPNPTLFPNGRDSVKAVIDKLHAAGISAGLHTYAFFIAKNTPYVTPVPDPRLGKDATYTLTAALDAAVTEVSVNESTADISLVTGFFARNSVTLQIDNELIVFSGVSKEAPFVFTGCTRGALGTQAAPHAAGAPVYKLKECFGLFCPDADSTLLAEVAGNTADTFNACGFDMIYLDALDGEDILGGRDNSWHYGSKFVYEIVNRLNRPALFEMSTFHHHLWCIRARMGAWDHPARAHKRFIDLHCAANNEGAGNYLPMNLGWWAVKNWQDGTAAVWSEPTYPDDIEYLLCKALGNGMSLSLMGVNPDNIGTMPGYQRLMPLFKRYEDLRHAGTVPESIKARLRVPRDEFVMETAEDGTPRFRPAAFHKQKINSPDPWNAEWTVSNAFGQQPARLRIEALPSTAPYDSPDAALVEDFADPAAFGLRRSAEGVQAGLERVTDLVQAGAASGKFTAANTRDTATGSWAQIGRAAAPPLNIADKPALGLWVHGDGSGALLNLQVLSAGHSAAGGTGDHYITLDFTGWRYFTLVEFESERISDLGWPYGNAYSIYREHVDFAAVESFSLWYNNVPPGGSATCAISPVKALPLVEAPVRNPSLTVNGVQLRFPVEIPCGASLEFQGMDTCVLYGKKGEELARVTPEGGPLVLEPGDNRIAFACDANPEAPARARVTVMSAGEPLTTE